jgi:hypothetical protein
VQGEGAVRRKHMAPEDSIFEKIAQLGSGATLMGVHLPRRQPSVADCVQWLRHEGLTRDGHSLQPDPARDPAGLLDVGNPQVLGVPSHRAGRMRKADRDLLQQRYRAERGKPQPSAEALNNLWNEWKNPAIAIRELDLARLPADALAFYRPFHFSPHEEWGIYILVEPLLHHCAILYDSFGGKLAAFNLETLMGCVLFEVFHHEFFHHLTECAATSIEIASAGFGKAKPIFTDYWDCRFSERGLGPHPDHPLEEALANAYAYNSFSFLSRMEIGFKLIWVKVYQKILEKCWNKEPAGYRSAGKYINAEYVSGAAQLLAMLLSSPDPDPASLLLLAKTVMPSGNSAFLQKPDIPTYLVGDSRALAKFGELVPAPNETYTSLFWLGDTSTVDEYLKDRKKKEALAKRNPA